MIVKNKIKSLPIFIIVVILSAAIYFALLTQKIKIQQKEISQTEEEKIETDKEENQQEIEDENRSAPEPKKSNQPLLVNNNTSESLNIINKFVSWGYEIPLQNRLIDTIIIHSSYDALGDNPYSVDGVIYEYKIYGVSPHYLIDREGTISRLVKEENIAYHAGGGKMPDGRTNINSFSIGIELINTKTVGPDEAQYSSLVKLVKPLKSKYGIKNILGHSEISPERKTDPWNFDWQKFNEKLKN